MKLSWKSHTTVTVERNKKKEIQTERKKSAREREEEHLREKYQKKVLLTKRHV